MWVPSKLSPAPDSAPRRPKDIESMGHWISVRFPQGLNGVTQARDTQPVVEENTGVTKRGRTIDPQGQARDARAGNGLVHFSVLGVQDERGLPACAARSNAWVACSARPSRWRL